MLLVMDPASIVLEEIRRRVVTATQALANEEVNQSTLLLLTDSIESSARNLLRLEDVISTQLFDSYLHLLRGLLRVLSSAASCRNRGSFQIRAGRSGKLINLYHMRVS